MQLAEFRKKDGRIDELLQEVEQAQNQTLEQREHNLTLQLKLAEASQSTKELHALTERFVRHKEKNRTMKLANE